MKKGELRNFAKFAGKHQISNNTFFTERPCSTTSKLMCYRPINYLNLGQI